MKGSTPAIMVVSRAWTENGKKRHPISFQRYFLAARCCSLETSETVGADFDSWVASLASPDSGEIEGDWWLFASLAPPVSLLLTKGDWWLLLSSSTTSGGNDCFLCDFFAIVLLMYLYSMYAMLIEVLDGDLQVGKKITKEKMY
jgi:hypothetical protein